MKKIMKGCLLLAFAVLLVFGCAGRQPAPEQPIERIVEASGYTKDQIFNGAKVWIAENFRSSKAVLEYEDINTGTIIGNGGMSYPCSGFGCMTKGSWRVRFTMRVDIKDYKFRLTFTNIFLSWPASPGLPAYDGPSNNNNDIEPILLEYGDRILASLNQNKIKSDW